MASAATIDEFNPPFMRNLHPDDVDVFAARIKEAEGLQQWASCPTLDTNKIARFLESHGKEAAMDKTLNVNTYDFVDRVIRISKLKPAYNGDKMRQSLAAVFIKMAPQRLWVAVLYAHVAGYDAFMLLCISIAVANHLVRIPELHLDPIDMPPGLPEVAEHVQMNYAVTAAEGA
jgi:hypothetical protein